jgi:hypothetical protein
MILKQIDRSTYSSRAEPVLGVFSSEQWLSAYGDDLHFAGIFRDERQMCGGFYFLRTKRMGVSFLKLPPYTPHCGLFYISESSNRSSVNSFSKEVVTEVCNYIRSQSATLTVLAFPSEVIDLQPFIWEKYKVVPNYTYRIDLRRSTEEIKADFDPKNRNVIAKAEKEGVEVKVSDWTPANKFDFFRNCLVAAEANVYEDELEAVFTKFSSEENSFCLEAEKDGQLLGMVLCVFDKKNCYYLLGGLDHRARVNGVNNLLVLRSIEKAKSLGCVTFDFEGSMLKGVEKFFRSFGPELVPYYTVNKANIFLEMLLKFKKRELF